MAFRDSRPKSEEEKDDLIKKAGKHKPRTKVVKAADICAFPLL